MAEPTRRPEEWREADIKAALIDALYAEGMIYGDTVVISEMPVASMARRADLVVANGRLVGFEIKSDGDKISRLSGQLGAYQKAFEGIVIVTGSKHLEECLKSTPPAVGIIAIDKVEDNLPKARMVRKPRLRMMGLEEAIQQMRADELYRLARRFDANPTCARDRFTLEGIVRMLPVSEVRSAALQAIKQRYRAPFQAFTTAREATRSTATALARLRRPVVRSASSARRLPLSAAESDTADLAALSLRVRPRRTR